MKKTSKPHRSFYAGAAGLALLAAAPMAQAQYGQCSSNDLLYDAIKFRDSITDLRQAVAPGHRSHGGNYCPLVYRMTQDLERDASQVVRNLQRNRPLSSMRGTLPSFQADLSRITARAYDQRLGRHVAFRLNRADSALDDLKRSVLVAVRGGGFSPQANVRRNIPNAVPFGDIRAGRTGNIQIEIRGDRRGRRF